MSGTGRFPALTKAVYDGTDVDAEASFETGPDRVLDAVAADAPGHRNDTQPLPKVSELGAR